MNRGGADERIGGDDHERKCYLGQNQGEAMRREISKQTLVRGGILAAVWIAAATGVFAQGPAENPAEACAFKNQTDVATVGQYQFAAHKSSDGACLQVTSGGKVVYSQSVDSFETYTLGQPDDAQDNIAAIANGTDVTGRGQPDMIVSLFTGGAHCCSIHFVFELQPTFKLLATLNDSNDDMAHFERLADGHYYYATADWTFGYWPTCFACSPSALVKLQWTDDAKGGGFHLAMNQMQTPAPTTAEWNSDISAAQKVVTAGDFCSLLKTSPYWPDLQPTLKDTPATCANAVVKPTS
jgi:hypothetical protein